MVSAVVKVLEATNTKVLFGFNGFKTRLISWASTFDTKCMRLPVVAKSFSAIVAINGPKSEPPIPIFTTSVMLLLARIFSAKANIGFKVPCTKA